MSKINPYYKVTVIDPSPVHFSGGKSWSDAEDSVEHNRVENLTEWFDKFYNPEFLFQVEKLSDEEFAETGGYEKLWEQFGEIPINQKDEIEEPFLHFEKGTYRFDIWHWFEEQSGVSVSELY